MAAEIHSRPQSSRPVLLNKIEGHQDAVNAAVLIPKEDGVITVGEDRTIRVWLKRDSGQYWPSIYHTVSSPCSSMAYHHESKRIFIGQDNGAIAEFEISEDFNKITFVKTYPAHQSRVSAIVYCPECEWVISTGHDKSVSWMCSRSGSLLGRHYFSSWASCLQFDHDTKHAFVGDYSGQITLLKLDQNTYSIITTLKGHEGSVGSLYWDPAQRLLFSGASDHSVIMWDIGGRKGRTLLLQGHHDRVQSLCYLQLTRQLVSCAADGGITVWNMDISREEAPQWLESDCCQKCEQPFFWNLKQMWDSKTIGLRQHHCRKCGKAMCGKCSSKRSTYPVMGFEFQVRVCDACYETIKEEDRTSLATFHEGKHNIAHMNMDFSRGLMVTCGSDRVVKMHFMLLFSRQGKLRLQKWFIAVGEREKKKIIREMTQSVLARQPKTCNFMDWKDLKIVYKRYASLYICCGMEDQDNELLTIEIMHRYVELLDAYFGNVCELDIIFNFEKAYFILDEFLMGGEVQETSKLSVSKCIEESDLMQEVSPGMKDTLLKTMEEYMSKPAF
ncbi:WD repeat and FYVE domain-containing protein 1-like isoform X1 [Polyodon spathula]|uniref:WD repeat and FYVE domain-containing protein 1-like isoform X1 n=2 Tax=Polyodon spathula TaxID=7913 RepID=UPI001B7D9755|nr:WD repeat and FYVE domain-containing protein 1-like isoform X1 [Polyodon spathula]